MTTSRREVHVFWYPDDYESADSAFLKKCDVVVIDILRATSTMLTALAHGVRRIHTCRSVEEAFEKKAALPNAILAGERGGWKVEGFDRGNSPREFVEIPEGRDVMVMTTTNGTRALRAARPAARILIGSFLNFSRVCETLQSSERPIAFFCAGTIEDFSLEDAIFASAVLDRLNLDHPARAIWTGENRPLPERLSETKNGRRLAEIHLAEDIPWCAQVDHFPLQVLAEAGEVFVA